MQLLQQCIGPAVCNHNIGIFRYTFQRETAFTLHIAIAKLAFFNCIALCGRSPMGSRKRVFLLVTTQSPKGIKSNCLPHPLPLNFKLSENCRKFFFLAEKFKNVHFRDV